MAFFVRIRKHLVNLDAIARIEDRTTPAGAEVSVFLINTEPLVLRGEEASRLLDFLSRRALLGEPVEPEPMSGLVSSAATPASCERP